MELVLYKLCYVSGVACSTIFSVHHNLKGLKQKEYTLKYRKRLATRYVDNIIKSVVSAHRNLFYLKYPLKFENITIMSVYVCACEAALN